MNTEFLSDLVITKIHSVHTLYSESGARGKKRERLRWAIIIKYEGESEYLSNQRQYHSNIDNIMLLPKGSFYEWHCTQSGHFCTIEFDSELTCRDIFSFPVKSGEKFLKVFQELEYRRTYKPSMTELESIAKTYDILLKLLHTAPPSRYLPTEKLKKIQPALEHIAKHWDTKPKNDELAALTGLSTVYFRKLFTAVMGQSPIDYIGSVRIKKAKEMLHGDFGSVTDIALSLGYLNIYDFSRDFKKHVGVSPTNYLKALMK